MWQQSAKSEVVGTIMLTESGLMTEKDWRAHLRFIPPTHRNLVLKCSCCTHCNRARKEQSTEPVMSQASLANAVLARRPQHYRVRRVFHGSCSRLMSHVRCFLYSRRPLYPPTLPPSLPSSFPPVPPLSFFLSHTASRLSRRGSPG